MSLSGLAKVFANTEQIRERLLATDSLISWPSPKLVGVARNPQAVRLNAFLLKKLADHWCPQWTSPRMLPIDEAKAEASSVLKHMVAKSV